MKKITSLLTALTITACSSLAMATNGWEDDWAADDIFIGIEGGSAYNKVEGGTPKQDDNKDNSTLYGLRVGSFWQDEMRGYFTVSINDLDDVGTLKDMKQTNILFSADYLFMPETELHPFIGVTLGATENKADNHDSKWGFSYGAQAGVIYQINNIDLEAGLRYLGNGTEIDHSSQVGDKLKIKDSRQFYLSASLHF